MKEAVIDKNKIGDLLKAAAADHQVFAPVIGNSEIEYTRITDGTEQVTLDFSNAKLSPKGVFFPQMETLLFFDYDTVDEIPEPENNIVVFGSRPCDALSLLYLDKIFGPDNKGYDDPYYMKRRENSVMISLACNNPCETCFCTSVGGGPADEKGSDILMFDLDENILFSAVTDRGEAFLAAYSSLVKPPAAGMAEKVKGLGVTAAAGMEILPVDKDTLKSHLDDGFEDADWDNLTRNCIGCGACTYLCPTCYCFDITDEQRMYKGKRIRTWDACQFPQFTKHASGHNPRNTKLERLRQRFMHKFSYLPENMGEIYCVGCGRCITNCPVNIDIREVIQTFAKK